MEMKTMKVETKSVVQNSEEDTRNNSNSGQNQTTSDDILIIGIDVESNTSVPCKAIFLLAIFIIISMITGILLVIFNAHKQTNPVCLLTLKTIATYSENKNAHPISIAFGDFNNDSRFDIVVANSGIDNIGIFLGDGNGRFLNPYFYSTGLNSHPCSVAVADFNHDNHLDIIVANHYTHTVDIFFGNGAGNFTHQVSYNTRSSRPQHVAVGDFNHDNRSDLVVVNYGTNTIDLLLGNDANYFNTTITYSTGYDSIPYYAVIVDLNADTWLDIIVANYGTSTINVFLGHTNGTLANQQTFSTGPGTHPYTLAVADFNNDRYLDIAVAYSGIDGIGIFLGNSNKTFTQQRLLSIGTIGPVHIAVSDFNNDTKWDFAIAMSNDHTIQIFLGNGDGYFATPLIYSTGYKSYPLSIVISDLNADNRSDLIVANNGTDNVGVFLGYDPGALQHRIMYTTNSNDDPTSIAVSDFNNDNHLDFVVSYYGNHSIGVYFGAGDGTVFKTITYLTGAYSAPYWVAADDINNDNQSDIVVANYGSNNIGIFFGFGNGTFADIKNYSTGNNSGPNSVTMDDLNGDNWLDIVVANYGSDNVGVFFALGNGNFANQIVYQIESGSKPFAVAIADYDNDKYLDIAVANFGASNIEIFFGFGNGTFIQQIKFSVGYDTRPYSIAVGDLNNDGLLDIATANRHSDTIGILLGLGNRTFAPVTSYKTGTYFTPVSLAFGDFNGDDQLDIVVANKDVSMIGVYLGFGNGTFDVQHLYPTCAGCYPYYVSVGDFNNDHRLDVVVAYQNISSVAIFLGYNYGALMTQTTYSTGSVARPISVALGDFDGDKKTDAVIANFGINTIDVLIQNSPGTFQNQTTYFTGSSSNPSSVAVGDFNKDNWLDIVVANYANDMIGIFFGYGNGSFLDQITYSTGSNSFPSSIVTTDFNHDNRSDIVVANSNMNNVGVFLADAYTSLTRPIMYSTGSISGSSFINVGDFNTDTHLDLVVANYGTNNIGIFFGFGNGTFAKLITYYTGAGSRPSLVAISDLNNDNRMDIIVANSGTDNVGIFLGLDNGTFAKLVTYSTGTGSKPRSVAIGDFNNDNRMDIIVANTGIGNVGIWLGLGDGTFTNQTTYSTGSSSEPYSVAVGDFNNDKRMDFVVANYRNVTIAIFLGLGNGSFAGPITYITGSAYSPSFVAIDDFNNDTRLDIVIANYGDNNIGVFLGFGDGTFSNQTKYSTGPGTNPYSVLSGDFNNDHQVDLAAVTYYGNTVDIFFGFGDGTFGRKMVSSICDSSLSQSLVLADFNGDKLLDVAVTNSGTSDVGVFLGYCCESFRSQTIYDTGNDSHPYSITTGDLNNDKNFDIIVANYGTNNIGVLLGFGNGSFANQIIYSMGVDSFPFTITIGDLNRDGRQDIVVGSHGGNYIAVLLGNGMGSFISHTLYYIGDGVQISAVVVGDLNNDNRLDIAFSNDGTNNIGILYGYDNGTFTAAELYSTGYNSGPCSLAVGDLNNDTQLDIIIINQNKNDIEILSQFC